MIPQVVEDWTDNVSFLVKLDNSNDQFIFTFRQIYQSRLNT